MMILKDDDELDLSKFAMVQNMIRSADENVKNCGFVRIFFI